MTTTAPHTDDYTVHGYVSYGSDSAIVTATCHDDPADQVRENGWIAPRASPPSW
jgi:hypothetical protein